MTFADTRLEQREELDMPVGLTYDDVLIVPRRSTGTSRGDIDTSTQLTRRLSLRMPVVSANMDTVTESEMAIAMAQLGGIGIIHRFLTVEEQVREVRRVKRYESHLIEHPVTIAPDATLSDALEAMRSHGISSLLVADTQRLLKGILTSRDIRFESDLATKVNALMTPLERLVTAVAGTSMEQARDILREHRMEKLPLVDHKGLIAGLITAKDITKATRAPHATTDGKGRLRVGAAIGVKEGFLERAAALLEADCDVLVVDVAHGHSDIALRAVKAVRKELGDVELIAGNVATAEGAADLVSAGADAVKVGVGPGSTCTTRLVTGSGVPQLTAIMDCAKVLEGIPLIADGGIKVSGDITKALAAGASSVMLGNLLAGTDESPGVPLVRNGQKYKFYRGMASQYATINRKQKEGEDLLAGIVESIVPEGVEALLPYRGSAKEVLHQLVGGLRSGISYAGARNLAELRRNARFVRLTPGGMRESGPHDVKLV